MCPTPSTNHPVASMPSPQEAKFQIQALSATLSTLSVRLESLLTHAQTQNHSKKLVDDQGFPLVDSLEEVKDIKKTRREIEDTREEERRIRAEIERLLPYALPKK
jgi:hypothetical protein